eukprot:4839510-Amphidinium_carterae.1
MPMLMTVQDGKPVLRVDPRAKRLLQACGGTLRTAGDEAPSKQSGKRVASLQSGVPGIGYEATKDRWRVIFQGKDFKAQKYLSTSAFKTEANTWEEARAAALQAAIECRHELLRRKDASAKQQARGSNAAAPEGFNADKLRGQEKASPAKMTVTGTGT